MPKLLGFTQSAFDPASRFRFVQFIPYLQKAGWTVDHRPNQPDRQWTSPMRNRFLRALHFRLGRSVMKANRLRDLLDSDGFDVVFVNRDFAAEGPLLQKVFSPLLRKTVFDFDDAIFVGRKENLVRWMVTHAAWVTPGNEYLAEYARQFSPRVTVIPTVIDTDRYEVRPHVDCDDVRPIRVGWSGSDQSVRATLFPHLPMLAQLQAKVDFELVVISNTKPRLPVDNLRWTFHPWRAEDEPRLQSKMDIGIMPLVNDSFQKGKCALKLLQYMAAGLPTVASPVGVNAQVIRPGENGFLASTDHEWHCALEQLIENRATRLAMGEAGRRICEEQYSIRRWLPMLLQIFNQVAGVTPAPVTACPGTEPLQTAR